MFFVFFLESFEFLWNLLISRKPVQVKKALRSMISKAFEPKLYRIPEQYNTNLTKIHWQNT